MWIGRRGCRGPSQYRGDVSSSLVAVVAAMLLVVVALVTDTVRADAAAQCLFPHPTPDDLMYEAEAGAGNLNFGRDGNIFAVGKPADAGPAGVASDGVVRVYTRADATAPWAHTTDIAYGHTNAAGLPDAWSDLDGAPGGSPHFGWSVDVDADLIAISANYEAIGGVSNVGAVSLYETADGGETWTRLFKATGVSDDGTLNLGYGGIHLDAAAGRLVTAGTRPRAIKWMATDAAGRWPARPANDLDSMFRTVAPAGVNIAPATALDGDRLVFAFENDFQFFVSEWTDDADGWSAAGATEAVRYEVNGDDYEQSLRRTYGPGIGAGGDIVAVAVMRWFDDYVGAVAIYGKDGGAWARVATVRHNTPTAKAYFGDSLFLSTSGKLLAVMTRNNFATGQFEADSISVFSADDAVGGAAWHELAEFSAALVSAADASYPGARQSLRVDDDGFWGIASLNFGYMAVGQLSSPCIPPPPLVMDECVAGGAAIAGVVYMPHLGAVVMSQSACDASQHTACDGAIVARVGGENWFILGNDRADVVDDRQLCV
mmetsp:Transcript_24858/g.86582  ORF Transcript_24858/g.86582 Transcript_24858/m.86582 type:complete len:544 (+) Transcript_24858:1677-3308(+)